MVLTIDIGNTNINIGVFNCENNCNFADIKPILKFQISAIGPKSADEYTLIFHSLFQINKIDTSLIKGSIISSVVPTLTKLIYKAIKKITNSYIYTIGVGIKTGLNIKIDSTAQLGSDIVANSVGALSFTKAPIAIVDYGTATTITLIDNSKTLCGVIIMPGVNLSIHSLASGTALLNQITIDTKKIPLIGKNSEESIKSGVIHSLAFATDGFINEIKTSWNVDNLSVISTGDYSKYITPICKTEITDMEDLTLLGLFKIYQLNNRY